jgi:hypothetical protein
MQRDSATYCEEPEDASDYAAWLETSFSLEARRADIAALLADSTLVSELHASLVPSLVEERDFWSRYFYRCAPGVQPRCMLIQSRCSVPDGDTCVGRGGMLTTFQGEPKLELAAYTAVHQHGLRPKFCVCSTCLVVTM